jgi:hypothetical protein
MVFTEPGDKVKCHIELLRTNMQRSWNHILKLNDLSHQLISGAWSGQGLGKPSAELKLFSYFPISKNISSILQAFKEAKVIGSQCKVHRQ